MPAARFVRAVAWKERDVPAGTILNVSIEEQAELIKAGAAEDPHAPPAPPPAPEPAKKETAK